MIFSVNLNKTDDMKKIIAISIIFLTISTTGYAQKEDHPFRIEMEPTSYIAKGWSLLGSYGVNENRNLHIGLYTIASTLPSGLNEAMFKNVLKDDELRLTFELASSIRYKIPYFLNTESNPYIGLFFGWETFRHTSSVNNKVTHMSNFFLTPQIGYEIYIYRQKIYLNPSVRIVYEFGINSDYDNPLNQDDIGPRINDWLWLPSFSIGIRL